MFPISATPDINRFSCGSYFGSFLNGLEWLVKGASIAIITIFRNVVSRAGNILR
jgi:hypothetical protein